MPASLPPESFRLYPYGDDAGFFVVHLASSLKELRQTMATHTGETRTHLVGAVIHATSEQIVQLIGVVYFSLDHLGSGLVSHELAHAAFRAMERRDLRVDHWNRQGGEDLQTSDNEEEFCLILERLTRQFWKEAYGRGFVA